MSKWKIATIVLVILLLVSVGLNVLIYQAADQEISHLNETLMEYKGISVGGGSILVNIDYYNKSPVIIKHTMYSGHEIEIEPGYIRYSCFNYDAKDTRLILEAKKLDKTPVNYYLFDYELYNKGDARAIIFGGSFTGDNQTYYLNRFSAMEVGRTYCVGFSVPTKIYTTEGEKDVATNAHVWVKAVIESHLDLYPEKIMNKK